ncbi:UDP-4-amino-4,6-dideoxy-N-acetyl-beta-L-altrosamine transaminase [Desulfohalobium retbaense]|uniref:UDP-4-keto-6-deoxy-N-acetylglucosamine4-aminotra nsferase n=1 Tax=Desulfohalobium retbaense (strain ATCC 49708 / DSM 5692 / JCM 16813 / HR100) TaxID=485915 RepID=C8WYZ1_DESRD|nr:UDP-4-amino-4,6-dideoxy-N-acetyl-beta-L-altrosamine transaminase [Desulfohalobium retbaense]ACV67907.1 UDP-4-keto-6-deoxy-N-acetylglucosamine4-aminotra nsferase [Desulfohalobium retbaense DSM 5692]
MIPYGRQEITEADIEAVVEVLRSDLITQGSKVPEFERAVTQQVSAKHAVATNSATSALHLACRTLGVGPGDRVWTSPITFVASANCALYCGAQVDFVDIDPNTYNMSVQALEAKLDAAERTGTLPKVVIPVHMCGQSCEMQEIGELAWRYGFFVLEDASHAIGGYYQQKPVGNCHYSDITVFSFHPVKIITTAEGGMAVTNNPGLAQQMELLRSHGITRDPNLFADVQYSTSKTVPRIPDHGPWYYQQIDLGYNYRMTDIQAALGLKQLERLKTYVTKRRKLAYRYDELLADLPFHTPWQNPDTESAWHIYIIRFNLEEIEPNRRKVFDFLRQQGIGVNVHYIPVHTQPYYRKIGFDWGMFPSAEKYYWEAITLPLFPTMTKETQNQVVNALKKIAHKIDRMAHK